MDLTKPSSVDVWDDRRVLGLGGDCWIVRSEWSNMIESGQRAEGRGLLLLRLVKMSKIQNIAGTASQELVL